MGADRIGRACWILDDETVAPTDGGGARPPAGIVSGIVREHGRRYVWVRPGTAAGPGTGTRRIYSAAQTGTGGDRTGAPLDGATAVLVLPFAPKFMLVRAGWRLYSGTSVRSQGYSEGLFIEGDTHVRAHFGNVNWTEFDNVGVLSDSVTTVSIGVLSDDYRYTNAFTLEYEPSTRTISFGAVNDPASALVPVVHSLIVAGS